MKRVFPLLIVIVVCVVLVSEISKAIDFYYKPGSFVLMQKVSAFHYFVLHENGLMFLFLKLLASAVVLVWWFKVLIFPEKIYLLRYVTLIYASFQFFVGVFVVSGINGLLQYAAGSPIGLFSFNFLASVVQWSLILYFGVVVVGIPLALVIFSQLHNRWIFRY